MAEYDIGDEIQVNSYTTGTQYNPATAALSGGGYVVIWSSDGQDGSGSGVYGQLCADDGSRLGDEFRVNTATSGAQSSPKVTALMDGGFVAVWTSAGQDGSGLGVYAQRYDADGHPVGTEFRVADSTAGDQVAQEVTGFPGGGFLVTWQSADGDGMGLWGKLFDAAGNGQDDFPINTSTAGNQYGATTTLMEGGGFVVTWNHGTGAQAFDAAGKPIGDQLSLGLATALPGGGFASVKNTTVFNGWDADTTITVQLYDNQGQTVGQALKVNTTDLYLAEDIQLTALANGNFVVTWVPLNGDYSGSSIHGQIFTANGSPVGSEFHLYDSGEWFGYDIAVLLDGEFAVAWSTTSGPDAEGRGVRTQIVDAGGTVASAPILLSDYYFYYPNPILGLSAITLADGGFAATWGSMGQDGSDWGVITRALPVSVGPAPVVVTGTDGPDILSGGAEANLIYGGAGKDTIDGGRGDDTLRGDAGGDLFVIEAGEGNDTIQDFIIDFSDIVQLTGFGIATFVDLQPLITQQGTDAVIGLANGETLTLKGVQAQDLTAKEFAFDGSSQSGTDGSDSLIGGTGADVLSGGGGDDTLIGGSGADTLKGGIGSDSLSGGPGRDSLLGSEGDDILGGSDGDDTLGGGGGNDSLTGGAGNDSLAGGGGNDILSAGSGDDSLSGSDGDDSLAGSGGNDSLSGGNGLDSLNGGADADWLNGGTGDDLLNGSTGDDTLVGGLGGDTVSGGAGADWFVYDNPGQGGDSILDFVSGSDVIAVSSVNFGALPTGSLNVAAFALAGVETATTRFIFNTADGLLSFDPDGTGALSAIAVATLSGVGAMAAADILILA